MDAGCKRCPSLATLCPLIVTMTNDSVPSAAAVPTEQQRLKALAAPFERPSIPRAVWQIVNSCGPFVLLWVAMYWTRQISWWLTVPLAALAGLFLVRIFIIFHDCGHGSFFASKRANSIVGFVSGLLTFTPYHHWRWEHAVHHATSGNLDARGMGDIWTMTVNEYLACSPWRKFAYRVVRNPIFLFGVGPLFLFVIWQRVPSHKARPRERREVHLMSLAILAMAAGLSWVFGVKDYLIIQGVTLLVAGAAGLWMFYVQHQFEDVYWEHDDKWSYMTAALEGSSYYKLPRILQWFSGNIGFHHIHHLNSHIPNYNLERCFQAIEPFQQAKPITLLSSLKTVRLRLWDEQRRRMIGFRELKQLRTASA